MQLSIVIICWNDRNLIDQCLRSIYSGARSVSFEVIISDNGSTDGSAEFIRRRYPAARVFENGSNLGFAKGNNAGIRQCQGEYVLILNPDTIVHDGTLDRLVAFAEQHPEAGAFGCRVLNPDGSYQHSARPFPTIRNAWATALCLGMFGRAYKGFLPDEYEGWNGNTERVVDWQSGCCVMFRGDLLKQLGGFDEQFFYHYEEVDLCRRVWNAGFQILFTPKSTITHLGGQSVGRYRLRFEFEKHRNRYRYFYKYFGPTGAKRVRLTNIAWLLVRWVGYSCLGLIKKDQALQNRLETYKALARWNSRLNPISFVEHGEEPTAEERLSPAQ